MATRSMTLSSASPCCNSSALDGTPMQFNAHERLYVAASHTCVVVQCDCAAMVLGAVVASMDQRFPDGLREVERTAL